MTWWTSAVGRTHAETVSFTAADRAAYALLTGDTASGDVPVGGDIPVGMLGGVISKILGTDLPGQGTNYLKQNLRVLDPARLGEDLTFRVTITATTPATLLVDLATTCHGADGRTVATGRALVLARGVGDPHPDLDSAPPARPSPSESER